MSRHCAAGHDLSIHAYVRPSSGKVECAVCRSEWKRKRKQRLKRERAEAFYAVAGEGAECPNGHPLIYGPAYLAQGEVVCSVCLREAKQRRKRKVREFDDYIDRVSAAPCWLWTGVVGRSSTYDYGYYRGARAHRIAWEMANGETVPEGMVVDHICRVTLCVNPAHLRVLTAVENTLIGVGPTAVNARKTHCIHGHAYTPENTMTRPDGGRRCRACYDASVLALRKTPS